jgi:hypothetical protein
VSKVWSLVVLAASVAWQAAKKYLGPTDDSTHGVIKPSEFFRSFALSLLVWALCHVGLLFPEYQVLVPIGVFLADQVRRMFHWTPIVIDPNDTAPLKLPDPAATEASAAEINREAFMRP